MLLHFKQLTSCPPPAPQGCCWPDWGVPENYHLSPLLIWYLGPPKPRKARTQFECPWPWACAWSACSWALIPEQPGISNNQRQRAVRGRVLWEGRRVKECCRRSKRGHRWPDNRECSGLWFAGLFLMELVCWPQNWAVSCSMSFSTPTPFPYPRAFWTQPPGEQWDRTSGFPCHEGSDSH